MTADTSAQQAEPAHTNRLIDETSPYLLQHAHNPVQWWPWGEEAFEEARRRQVPIFLSIGYSTCYWCHVMERESFENPQIARLMNLNYVNIKVDREERPDIDEIYMIAVQLFTEGQGGWPMSVWLTPPGSGGEDDPGLKPFYAKTYIPPEAKYGRYGMIELIARVRMAWEKERPQLIEQAENTADAIRTQFETQADVVQLLEQQIGQAVSTLLRLYDRRHGGFGQGPNKFPQPVYLEFLIDTKESIEDPAVQSSVEHAMRKTLDRMAIGGIFDQVGGGFHRYSTDPQWVVPHFEKMLYDNGQLASLYAHAVERWDDDLHKRTLRRTLDWVLREMTDEQGGFYSAQDAEVDRREGWPYLWTPEQVKEALSERDAEIAIRAYGLDDGPNFQDPHDEEAEPMNVLHLPDRPDEMSLDFMMGPDQFIDTLDDINAQLLEARLKRNQPSTDDKVLTEWNGLMITGMAEAAIALRETKYLEAAKRAADFILSEMRNENGELLRSYRAGEAQIPAFLEDYAFFIQGLLALHRAERRVGDANSDRYAREAVRLFEEAEELFSGEVEGVLYDTRPDQRDLIVRVRSTYDGAVPSGASVMLHNMIDLAAITNDPTYIQKAVTSLGTLSQAIHDSPVGSVNSTRALHRLFMTAPEMMKEIRNAPEPQEEPGAADPVSIFASADRVSVPEQGEGKVSIEFRIADGHHINAPEPGVEGLKPLSIRIEGGTGVEIEADYPEPTAYEGQAIPADMGQLNVYEGMVRIDLVLRRTDEQWSGRPLIVVEYQVCTDEACLPPETRELDIAIDRAPNP